MARTPQIVGQSPLRKEGAAKVLGRAQYVDDITLPGMWFGATVRSTIPRGRISSIARDVGALMRRHYSTNPWTRKATPYVWLGNKSD